MDEVAYSIDNLFLFVSAVLVLFMQAGFAMVEAGFNSAKNTVNIMFKNIIDLASGVFFYFLIGYSLMYGGSVLGGFLGLWWSGHLLKPTPEALPGNLNPQVEFLFQAVFAATAATIVSGAVAGRMKISGYLIYSIVVTAIIYPVSGHWKWGGGWLDQMGFYDFAGSLVVHGVGGFAALAAVIVLGPASDASAAAQPIRFRPATWQWRLWASSSCGLAGTASTRAVSLPSRARSTQTQSC